MKGGEHDRKAARSEAGTGSMPAVVRAANAAFQLAASRHPESVRESTYEFAGRPVCMRVIGAAFAFRTCRALQHLRTSTSTPAPALDIRIWDETETGVTGPSRALFDDLGRNWIACGGTIAASADGRFVGFRYEESVVILDRTEQCIVGYRRDGAYLSGGEYSKPLLLILSVWYHGVGVQPLHTALVAHEGAGIMVPGVSGSGKSTTALASLTQGLEFLGDDYVGLERISDGRFVGHSFFSSTCLVSDNFERFPELRSHAVEDASSIEEKPILFLAEIFEERILKSAPVKALALLQIRQEQTRIEPARPAEVLRHLAASTLHTVVPRPGRDALRMLGELVETTPCFWLYLGPDLESIGPSIQELASLADMRTASRIARSGPTTSRTTGSASRPRVLVLAESLPWPASKGGDLRTWQNVCALTKIARVGVFGLCSNDSRIESQPDVGLEFWKTSTDPVLSSPPPVGVNIPGRAWLLDPSGHPSDIFYSEAAATEIAQLLETFRPDIALVEGLWMHRYLDMIRGAGCSVVLDCHNIEGAVFDELARTEDKTDLPSRVKRQIIPARTQAIEQVAVHAVDELWVCSEDDERDLRERYAPNASVTVIPNSIRVSDYDATFALRRERLNGDAMTLVYPGIFSYLPNGHAASYLIEELLPPLASRLNVPVSVVFVGAMPTEGMLESARSDRRIVVTGAVRDVRPHLATASAMPVPLFHGSGTRFKVLEAFASGLPVVTTRKGIEGLDAEHQRDVLIANSAAEFVDSLIAVQQNAHLAERLVTNARKLALERFSWGAVAPRIRGSVLRLHSRGNGG